MAEDDANDPLLESHPTTWRNIETNIFEKR